MTPLRGRPPGQHHGAAVVRPDNALIADVRRVALTPGRRLRTRVAGIVLFLPLLAQVRFDRLVARADSPGSRMVPATACGAVPLRRQTCHAAVDALVQVLRGCLGTPLVHPRGGLLPEVAP